MSIRNDARYAEVLVSPEYRTADSATFDENPDTYHDIRDEAREVIIAALSGSKSDEIAAWDMRREATRLELGGVSLGAYGTYFHSLEARGSASGKAIYELDKGEQGEVKTNDQIIALKELHKEPIDFFEAALKTIEDRKQVANAGRTTGPANYATAMKFFTDKYLSFPGYHLDQAFIKSSIDEAMGGFLASAEEDRPNFIEMTNVFFTIRELPKGSVDAKFSKDLVDLTLTLLPEFDNNDQGNMALSLLLGAFSKLDLSEPTVGQAAAHTLDLTLRKGRSLETSREYRRAISAIANLPAVPAANLAFATFMEKRNNIEQSLGIYDFEHITNEVLRIIDTVIDDPKVTLDAKTMSYEMAEKAQTIYTEAAISGNLTALQLEQMRDTARKTIQHYNDM